MGFTHENHACIVRRRAAQCLSWSTRLLPRPGSIQSLLDGATVCEWRYECVLTLFAGAGPQLHAAVTLDGVTDTLTSPPRRRASSWMPPAAASSRADGVTDNTASFRRRCPPAPRARSTARRHLPHLACFCRAARRCISKRGALLPGGTNRTDYPIPLRCSPCHNEKDEHRSVGGNPLDSFAGLINVNAENVTITGEARLTPTPRTATGTRTRKEKNIAWRPRSFFTSGAKNVAAFGVKVCNKAIPDHPPDLLRK